MKLKEALEAWAALRAPVVKPRTQRYHQEVIAAIVRHWPEKCDSPGDEIKEADVTEFLARVAPLSASRFNAMVIMLRATIPAARQLKQRRLTLKERHLLSQLEFDRLLGELDKRPKSHGGLVIRFLSQTGLRINEARQLRWSDIDQNFIRVPAVIAKNGHARSIPLAHCSRICGFQRCQFPRCPWHGRVAIRHCAAARATAGRISRFG